MGSRAVAAGLPRRGGRGPPVRRAGDAGVVWTRTGRAVLPDRTLTARVAGPAARGGRAGRLFDELDTDWLLLDAELLPWSAKAERLLARPVRARRRGRGGRALPAALDALASGGRGRARCADLLPAPGAAAATPTAFTDAYRRYCWPTDGLNGVRIAPFQLLATDGAAYQTRPHSWHLEFADRLVAADPELVAPTRGGWLSTPPTQARSRPAPTGGRS